MADFGAKAPPEMIVGFWRAVSKIAHDLGLDPRAIASSANHGPNGGQLVFHFHVHIFGGRIMSHGVGSMPSTQTGQRRLIGRRALLAAGALAPGAACAGTERSHGGR